MRILFLTQVLPFPLDAGPKVRAYYVLRQLVEAGHEVTLLSFIRSGDETESIAHLRSICGRVHTVPISRSSIKDALALIQSLFTQTPALIGRDSVSQMRKKIRSLLDEDGPYDAIHADQLWMAPYAAGYRGELHTVLDQHNAVFQIPARLAEAELNGVKRLLLRREARMMKSFEKNLCDEFAQVVWVSDRDLHLMNGDGRSSPKSTVIPICLDPQTQGVLPRISNPHRVAFLGGMHWPPNAQGIEWFAGEVWPRVLRKVPGAVLTVIGRQAPRSLKYCESVEVTGYLPDLTDYLAECAVFIVPLLAGGGMRVKILDAWCRGLPVVSTRIGAEGLRIREGDSILLADCKCDFADAVVQVLLDTDLSNHLAKEGRSTVETWYDWKNIYPRWEKVYGCVSSS